MSQVRFLAARLNRLVWGKRVVSKPWWLGVGSAFRLRVVSTRVARSSRSGSTSFRGEKLVEPILTSVSERVVAHVNGFAGHFALDVLHVVGA